MSLSLEHGISSGDLNTGGNLSDSSDAVFCSSSITHHDLLEEIG